MRRFAVAMLLATVATPALAHPRHAEDLEAARAARALNDPQMQSAMSGAMLAMADMFMDMRVDKLRAAIARIDPDARYDDDGARTVGDMMARDDPYFRERMAGQTRTAVRTMGAAASGMADMLPEFRAMAEAMQRHVAEVVRKMPRD